VPGTTSLPGFSLQDALPEVVRFFFVLLVVCSAALALLQGPQERDISAESRRSWIDSQELVDGHTTTGANSSVVVIGKMAHSTCRCDNHPNCALLFGGICIQRFESRAIVAPRRHGAVFGPAIWWLTP